MEDFWSTMGQIGKTTSEVVNAVRGQKNATEAARAAADPVNNPAKSAGLPKWAWYVGGGLVAVGLLWTVLRGK